MLYRRVDASRPEPRRRNQELLGGPLAALNLGEAALDFAEHDEPLDHILRSRLSGLDGSADMLFPADGNCH